VKFEAITKDERGVEVRSYPYPAVNEKMNEYVRFPNGTRTVEVEFEQGGVYEIDSLEVGTWHNSYAQAQECRTFTQAEIDVLG